MSNKIILICGDIPKEVAGDTIRKIPGYIFMGIKPPLNFYTIILKITEIQNLH